MSKTWFITGASRGFGRIWAEAALERGDRIVGTARNTASLATLQDRFPDRVLLLPLDVTDRDAVFAAIEKAMQRFDRLDVILCNAGYGYMGAVEELVPAEARANFDTNVFGTLSVIQAALPHLRRQRSGHVLTLSSIGGIIGFPNGGTYVASKFAVEGLTEALAGEVASFGIKVTLIEPGAFETSFRSSMIAAPPIAEYDEVRQTIESSFKPEMLGDPAATSAALFSIVDAKEPPLRLLLGDWLLPMITKSYDERLDAWTTWAEVSNESQGKRPLVGSASTADLP